jgi:hypothetical protein
MREVAYYIAIMSIEDLEKAVAGLPPDQYAQFRTWFEAFEADRFDRKIERDVQAGKLDRLADQAIDDCARAAPARTRPPIRTQYSPNGRARPTRRPIGTCSLPKHRHPEVRAKRASKGAQPSRSSFEGRFAATSG